MMFRLRPSRTRRLRHEARVLADRGLHRAEDLREALPEPADLLSDLRGQAFPVVEAAREQAGRVRHRRRSSVRKPMLIAALVLLAAGIAYALFSRRDKEPAVLMGTPQAPTAPSVDDSGPGGEANETSTLAVDESRPTANGNGYRVDEPVVAPTAETSAAQPSTTGSSSGQSSTGGTASVTDAVSGSSSSPASSPASSNGSYGEYPPRARAAWDFPSR